MPVRTENGVPPFTFPLTAIGTSAVPVAVERAHLSVTCSCNYILTCPDVYLCVIDLGGDPFLRHLCREACEKAGRTLPRVYARNLVSLLLRPNSGLHRQRERRSSKLPSLQTGWVCGTEAATARAITVPRTERKSKARWNECTRQVFHQRCTGLLTNSNVESEFVRATSAKPNFACEACDAYRSYPSLMTLPNRLPFRAGLISPHSTISTCPHTAMRWCP